MPEFKAYVRARLRALEASPEREQDIVEEIAAQLEDAYLDLVDRGVPDDEAYRRALEEIPAIEELGGRLSSSLRPSSGVGGRFATTGEALRIGASAIAELLSPFSILAGASRGIGRDLAYAARSLRHRLGYAAGVALTLALGIGATTAVYAVVDGVLLKPLGYDDPSTIVHVGSLTPGQEWVEGSGDVQNLAGTSLPNFFDLSQRTQSLTDLHVVRLEWQEFSPGAAESEPEMLAVALTSAGFFDMLGVSPMLGRTFVEEENDAATPELGVVITYGIWQRRFAGDPDVVGRPLQGLNLPLTLTIVGVLPKTFHAPAALSILDEEPAFWVPLPFNAANTANAPRAVRGVQGVHVFGRLSPGASVAQARDELAAIASNLAEEYPSANTDRFGEAYGLGLNTLDTEYAYSIGVNSAALGLFLGAASLLLLLAAMNGATLVLARSLDRTRELGVRASLGASRGRLVRLLAGEAAIVAIIGGGLGVLLAYLGVTIFVSYAPEVMSLPRLDAIGIDAHVLTLAALVTAGAGLIVGLLPALRLTRRGLWRHIQSGGHSVAGSSSRFGALLVGGQIALSVVLLAGAGLLFNSFIRMRTADFGFDPDGLMTMQITWKGVPSVPTMPVEDRPRVNEIVWDLLRRELLAVPGVESVGIASNAPFETPYFRQRLLLPGETAADRGHDVVGYMITPGYLDAMGIELIRGRDIGAEDTSGSEKVVLVNETFARTLLPDADPIGAVIRWSAATEQENSDWAPGPYTPWNAAGDTIGMRIVGIIGDVVQASASEPPKPAIYVSHAQGWINAPWAMVRSSLPSEIMAPQLRAAAARYNPAPDTLWDGPREVTPPDGITLRFQTLLIGAFALVAELIAVAGLYGIMTHSVRRGQREYGIRMALGSDRGQVLRLVLAQGMRLTTVGLAVGLVVSLFASRMLTAFLFGIKPYDPGTLIAISLVLVAVSALACLVPAWRATSVNPSRVLAEE